jgi:methylmalonyl-CoA/ethylmalonyl-CoA epimerase
VTQNLIPIRNLNNVKKLALGLLQALPEHGVMVVFVQLDNTKLELLHPLGEKSPIQGFLDKNKAG